MSTVHIYLLPKATDPALLEPQIRLQSRPLRQAYLDCLRSDPENFFSVYENEVEKPLEIWHERVRPTWVEHFVAVTSDRPRSDELAIDDSTSFVAFLVLINEWLEKQAQPSTGCVPEDGASPTSKGTPTLPTFFLAVVGVAASQRSLGLGTRIIAESIEYIKQHARKVGWGKVRYRLGAKDTNARALKLYERLGFQIETDPPEEKEGEDEVSMSLIIDVDA